MFQDNVPPEIAKGIRDTIGRKNVVTLKKMVKLERSHGNKTDSKVLVLTPYRCQLLGVKPPFKMEADFHFLHIRAMDSPSPDRLTISTKQGKVYFLQMIGSDDADDVIGRVALSLRTIFPNISISRILKATLEPLSRQKGVQAKLNEAEENEPGPCGNFSEMYRCWCDYLNVPVKEDVEWDVDTIYLSQNCKDINLTDFELSDSKDIIPIISVMTFSRWFEGLVVKNTKLNNDVLDVILRVARASHNLKKLVLDGVALKGDFAHRLSTQIIENKDSCIEVLDLSNNPVEDKGLLHLSGMLPLIKNGSIRKLNFSKTGLTSKGVNGLSQSLRSSPNIMNNLTSIDLSGNTFKTDEVECLCTFLATENHLTEIDLSATECSVDAYMAALAKGCTIHLQSVRLGRNHFHAKKKDNVVHPTFQEFFEKAKALKLVDFSNMKFPPDALRYVMNGLLRNKTKDLAVELILTSCELKSAGCQVLQSSIGSMTTLAKLDVSDNSFDTDLVGLLAWIQQNRHLRELRLGRNFSGIKPKHMKKVMDALVEVVQEEESNLNLLSLADSKIRDYLSILLGCLGSNSSLTSLDISGNYMGDPGARVLAKSLQINSKLKVLELDRNSLTALGFHEIATALEKNFTLRYMPYPINDAIPAMKHYAERVQSSLARIQNLLLRNGSIKSASSEQQFRLQKVVASTAQIVLDRMADKVDDAISALQSVDDDSSSDEEVKKAKKLVQDASNSKQLLTAMYGLAMEKTTGHGSRLNGKIDDVAEEWEKIAQDHFKDIVSVMLQNAEANCPHIYEEISTELRSCVDQRCRLEPGAVKDDVIKTSGVDLVNRMSELNLAAATLVSDTVTDKLLAALSQCSSTLTEKLNKTKERRKSDPAKQEAAEQKEKKNEQTKDAPKETAPNGESEPQSELLPTMRRQRAQSVAKRRQRPVASSTLPAQEDSRSSGESPLPARKVEVVIEEEIESQDISQTDGTDSQRLPDISDELPDSEEVLDHVTKSRPRGPNNRQRRKRPAQQGGATEVQDVDSFFQNNVSNTDFSEVLTVQEEEEKKRKEKFKESRNKTVSGAIAHHINVDALKGTKTSKDDSSEKGDVSVERSPIKSRPKTMFALPGAGMGNDLLAEIKLKKLAKKTNDDSGRDKAEERNQNNNNSNAVEKPVPRARKKTIEKDAIESSRKEGTPPAKEAKAALMPGKKLTPGKAPPPLPTKPKPPLLRGNETKPRPFSEFHEGKLPPLFKPRASSMKTQDKDDE